MARAKRNSVTYDTEQLASTHNREAFVCGKPSLDNYLEQSARQDQNRRLSQTFVATDPKSRGIRGYYTIASHSLDWKALPTDLSRKLPRYPVPSGLIGRLAIDRAFQGTGLGTGLLTDAIKRIAAITDMPAYAVVVGALHERAEAFYLRYGFVRLPDQQYRLFLPLAPFLKRP